MIYNNPKYILTDYNILNKIYLINSNFDKYNNLSFSFHLLQLPKLQSSIPLLNSIDQFFIFISFIHLSYTWNQTRLNKIRKNEVQKSEN